MGQDITTDLPLLALDDLDVGLHSVLGESLGEGVADVGVGVETTELFETE